MADDAMAGSWREVFGGAVGGWAGAVAILIGATLLAVVDSDSGLETWLQLRHDAREMRARVATIRADVDRLGSETEALRADPLALECAIREDLELARAGEWVIRFAPNDNTNPRFP